MISHSPKEQYCGGAFHSGYFIRWPGNRIKAGHSISILGGEVLQWPPSGPGTNGAHESLGLARRAALNHATTSSAFSFHSAQMAVPDRRCVESLWARTGIDLLILVAVARSGCLVGRLKLSRQKETITSSLWTSLVKASQSLLRPKNRKPNPSHMLARLDVRRSEQNAGFPVRNLGAGGGNDELRLVPKACNTTSTDRCKHPGSTPGASTNFGGGVESRHATKTVKSGSDGLRRVGYLDDTSRNKRRLLARGDESGLNEPSACRSHSRGSDRPANFLSGSHVAGMASLCFDIHRSGNGLSNALGLPISHASIAPVLTLDSVRVSPMRSVYPITVHVCDLIIPTEQPRVRLTESNSIPPAPSRTGQSMASRRACQLQTCVEAFAL